MAPALCLCDCSGWGSHRQPPSFRLPPSFASSASHVPHFPSVCRRHRYSSPSNLSIHFLEHLRSCFQNQAMDARRGHFTISAAAPARFPTTNAFSFCTFYQKMTSFWRLSGIDDRCSTQNDAKTDRISGGKSCRQARGSPTFRVFGGEINAGVLMRAFCLIALGFGGEACAIELGFHHPQRFSSDLIITSTSMVAPFVHFRDSPCNDEATAPPVFVSSTRNSSVNSVKDRPMIHQGSIDDPARVYSPRPLHYLKTAGSVKCLQKPSNDLVFVADNLIDRACDGIGDAGEADGLLPQEVTNESVVEEAWQVVNDLFLDARHGSWSQAEWLRRKEEVFRRPIPSRMAAYAIIKRMLSSLDDPFTRFLTPAEFTKMAKYDLTGIGINIGEWMDETGANHLKVLGTVLGGPAHAAGVREGDERLSVEGKSVVGKSAFEASSLIRGPNGSPVSIEIKHGPCGQLKNLVVDRYQDVNTPVYYRLESSKDSGQLTGYIRLKEFNGLAKRDLVIAMKRLRDSGASSFILDLRDNLGGLVQSGIEIAKLFLEEGDTIVYTVGREAGSGKNITATGLPLTRAPLIILVNNQTASASEIVAAALRDNCRALLVGRKTFGKGLIQSVYELSDGSGVVLTVGKYVTPGQHDIDQNGIEPDFKQVPLLSDAREKLARCQACKRVPVPGLSKMASS